MVAIAKPPAKVEVAVAEVATIQLTVGDFDADTTPTDELSQPVFVPKLNDENDAVPPVMLVTVVDASVVEPEVVRLLVANDPVVVELMLVELAKTALRPGAMADAVILRDDVAVAL